MSEDTIEATTAVATPDTAAAKAPQSTRSPEHQLRDFNLAARLGRGVFEVACDRRDHRYTPFVDSERIPKEDLAAIGEGSLDIPPTETEIHQAEAASLAIALEATAQVAEVTLPRTGVVRDDPESLDRLINLLRKGHGLRDQLAAENPGLVEEKIRAVVARRLRKPPEEVAMSTSQLTEWANQQSQGAILRLTRKSQALKEYFGVRLR